MTVEAQATSPAAPVQAAPPAAPSAVAVQAPAEKAAPAAPASAAAASPPAGSTPAETKEGSTLLSEKPKEVTDAPAEGQAPSAANSDAPPADKVDEVKKDAAPAEGDPKKEEGSQSDKTAPQPPTYEQFKLEEGVTFDQAKLGEFTNLLAEIETAKGDHSKMQEAGQKLIDKHVAEVKSALQKQQDYIMQAVEKQKNDWLAAFENDAEIGKNQKETTVEYARQFITNYAGNDVQQQEFRELMRSSGIGNHPAMIRLLATAMKSMTKEGSPVPAQNLNTAPKSKVEKRYGKMS